MGRDFPGSPRAVQSQKATFFRRRGLRDTNLLACSQKAAGADWGRGAPGMLCGAHPPAGFESRSGPPWGCGGAIMGAPALPPTWQLYLKDHRISTFKNWPFLEDCSCTPERVSRPLLGPQCPPTDISVPASSDSTPGPTVY